jgi:hypothetical protein
MNKLKVSFTLSEDAMKLLKKLAEKNLRSAASMVEVLIIEAAKKEKIK